MDKKDIYEHLAKIYLDASSKKKKRFSLEPRLVKSLAVAGVVIVIGVTGLLVYNSRGKEAFGSEVSLYLSPGVLKLNFNFDPAKKEIYSLDLKKLNMTRFKTLAFSVKKANPKDTISLRVEFSSIYNEKGVVYFKDISSSWQEYKVGLADFQGISEWSEMGELAFAVEEWNVREKQGVVYIDDVRLLKDN